VQVDRINCECAHLLLRLLRRHQLLLQRLVVAVALERLSRRGVGAQLEFETAKFESRSSSYSRFDQHHPPF
jgi:hypothetical protein